MSSDFDIGLPMLLLFSSLLFFCLSGGFWLRTRNLRLFKFAAFCGKRAAVGRKNRCARPLRGTSPRGELPGPGLGVVALRRRRRRLGAISEEGRTLALPVQTQRDRVVPVGEGARMQRQVA